MLITSRHNPLLQELRRAISTGRRTADGLLAAEGPHLLEEARRSSWPIERLLVTPAALRKFGELLEESSLEVIEVSEEGLASVVDTENSQGVLTLLRPQVWSWRDLTGGNALVTILDGVQDPGNAGTIVRSAEAFGSTGLALSRGSVRVSNAKLIRASAGSVFRMPFVEGETSEEIAAELSRSGIPMYVLSPRAEISIDSIDLSQRCALVVGSEGHGVSRTILAQAVSVSIPAMRVESLNAAVACSIALFQAFRQRVAV